MAISQGPSPPQPLAASARLESQHHLRPHPQRGEAEPREGLLSAGEKGAREAEAGLQFRRPRERMENLLNMSIYIYIYSSLKGTEGKSVKCIV